MFWLEWYSGRISSHANSWINTAITKEVNKLFLRLRDDYHEKIEIPIKVFSCVSLRSLLLEGNISVSDAMGFCLPKLENLSISSIYFESQDAFERLISGCQMLNYLYLEMEKEESHFTFIISSTSLRHLELDFTHDGYKLILKTSSLEYFMLHDGVPKIFVQKSLSSLVEAEFCFGKHDETLDRVDYCNSLVEALSKFDRAKALNLSGDITWALHHSTVSLSAMFTRLVKLEIGTYCCAYSSLQDFLQNSENLEVLIIHKSSMDLDSKWATPVEVPRYLTCNLKKIVIDGYKGFEDEREMLRYMLKHGNVLETIQISCHKTQFELLQEIREFPRKSPSCEIKEFFAPKQRNPRAFYNTRFRGL